MGFFSGGMHDFSSNSRRIVHDVEGMKLAPPQKTATPYGGRLSWRLPGGNLLVVHLKDKIKVSKKKRWSMVRLHG